MEFINRTHAGRLLAKKLDAELVIASDHGFDWGGAHPESSTATATAAKWHRNEGVWIHWPRQRARLQPAHVDQVCATLLGILGLPPGEGIAAPIGAAPAGESVNYRRFFARAAAPHDTAAGAAEPVAKLKSLGYLSPAPATGTSTRTPQSFNNEGLILREAKRVAEAEQAFREALALQPDYASARTNLDDLLATRAVERLRQHDCSGALADFRGVQRESALLWTGIAAAEGCLGHEEAAQQAFQRAAALDPGLAAKIAR